jgi:HEAT repeat protein
MQDPNSHVRFYTARALGMLGDERALPVLVKAKAEDTDPITDTQS